MASETIFLSIPVPSSRLSTIKPRVSRATRQSPLLISASILRASSSYFTDRPPKPFSVSDKVLLSIPVTSSALSLLNSYMLRTLLIMALFTEKYGFSVVLPMNLMIPSSSALSSESCCSLFHLCTSSTYRTVVSF